MVRGRARVQKAVDWLGSQIGPAGRVLLYHRVADVPTDPFSLSVSPARFAEQLAVLRRHAVPLSLEELVDGIERGGLPRRAVAVTFDDGYRDNLLTAAPLLERHRVPATVFVATGYAEAQREFWWDELERLILHPGELPRRVGLRLDGDTVEAELGGSARYTHEDFERHAGWKVPWNADEPPPTERHALFLKLWRGLRVIPHDMRRRALDELAQLGRSAEPRSDGLALTSSGVREIAASRAVDVGAHTVTHPVLSSLDPERQREEIEASQRWLSELLGRPVRTLSYPFGWPADYTRDTMRIAREACLKAACAASPGAYWRTGDRFRIPRFGVGDWTGDEFRARLKAVFG